MKLTVVIDPRELSRTRSRRVAGLRVFGSRTPLWFRDRLKDSTSITVGRVRQRDIRIRDESVSKLHCTIEKVTERGRVAFRIHDEDSKNGVFISPLGRYSEFVEVDTAILHLGMWIRLGEILLTPINENGSCVVFAARHSEFARELVEIYGSPHAVRRQAGFSRKLINRMLARFGSDSARFSMSRSARSSSVRARSARSRSARSRPARSPSAS